MKFNLEKHWPLLFPLVGGILLLGWTVYIEIQLHYFIEFNGRVVQKLQIPPKKMPDLVVQGTDETFPVWKWEGIDFDSVQIGDSIIKKKYESKAYFFKRNSNGTFKKTTLKYWTD